MGQGTEGAVSRRVGVTADDGHAGQRCALLRTNNMHDTLTLVGHLEFQNAEVVTILIQGFHLNLGDRVLDTLNTDSTLSHRGRYIVVRGRQVGIDTPGLASGQTQAFKGLG